MHSQAGKLAQATAGRPGQCRHGHAAGSAKQRGSAMTGKAVARGKDARPQDEHQDKPTETWSRRREGGTSTGGWGDDQQAGNGEAGREQSRNRGSRAGQAGHVSGWR